MAEIEKTEKKEEVKTKKSKGDIWGTGRRKTAVASVKIYDGQGKITVNGADIKKYFPILTNQVLVKKPLELLGLSDKYNVKANVRGGGNSSQADAIRLGISRALVLANEGYRSLLSKNGLLTRDPRMVERKKYGKAGARKRFQFSKR